MQDRTSFKMPPTTDECDVVVQSVRITTPETQHRVVCDDPLAIVFMQVNRDSAERPAPLDHGRVVMRMRNGDRGQSTAAFDDADGFIIDQCEAIPQDVAAHSLEKECTLTYCER